MNIRYSISLWNFYHYANLPSLERFIPTIRELGYGIELWGTWKEENDLYDPVGRKRVKPLVQDMTVSLHTTGGNQTFERHQKQIDAAADFGAPVIVLHPEEVLMKDSEQINVSVMKDAVGMRQRRA